MVCTRPASCSRLSDRVADAPQVRVVGPRGPGQRVRRREIITLLGGTAVAWPNVLRAQQKAMPVIGILGPTSPGPFAGFVTAFRQGLNKPAMSTTRTWQSNTAGRRAIMIGC